MSVVGMKLIFQGIYKSSIDVIIVEHVDQNVTELIMYDPSHCKEAPRMYFNSTVLDFQLNHEAIEHQLSFAKQNKVVITAKLVDGIVNEAKSNYILDRIVVTKRWEESKGLDFNFQPNNEDRFPVGLICERPKAAQPYRTVFYQNFV